MTFATNPFRRAGRGVLATAVGLALIVPAQASANGDAVWTECAQTGTVSTNHSQADFESALANQPADASEYTDCVGLIKAAQVKAARGGSSSSGSTGSGSSSGAAGGGTSSGGGPSAGAGATASPEALSKALQASGINPAAPVGAAAPAPAPTVIDGKSIDPGESRAPSIANAFSLPLPLAASAVVVLFSAALPLVRYAVGRFGPAPAGTEQTP
ncbi:MAG: hypothetical protein AAGC46_02580 [Solirubrobacteraceae bacterium]|nr:hypothetical protein [Patulibacter sp.]